MPGPLEGIRVVEIGFWVAGPGAAGILADWGADVVKIEPPEGDPFRGMFMSVAGMDVPFNPPFELDNRGKRSAALNLQHPDGRAVVHRLLADADVFVSNLRQPALARMGLDYETLSALNARLGDCHVSGPAPEFAQHTEEILLELGYAWETIARLKETGAIP